jgi:hypothetical protein
VSGDPARPVVLSNAPPKFAVGVSRTNMVGPVVFLPNLVGTVPPMKGVLAPQPKAAQPATVAQDPGTTNLPPAQPFTFSPEDLRIPKPAQTEIVPPRAERPGVFEDEPASLP